MDFQLALETHLGEQFVPLTYILRPDKKPTDTSTLSRDQRIYWNAPHSGPAFEKDNKNVFKILQKLLRECTAGNVLEEFKQSTDGAAAW